MSAALVEVDGLTVGFPRKGGIVDVVRNVSFSIGREKVGIVGESGSGKSMTGRALLGLIRPPGRVSARELRVGGVDLLNAGERAIRSLRGNQIGMIMQDPKFSLNPVMRIGEQISEAYMLHRNVGRAEARLEALKMLERVKIRDPERVFDAYPHQISGGMGQRVMIAMMLAPEPGFLIADEPTSALDMSVQLEVLSLIDQLVKERQMGLMFISHDLNQVAAFCDRVIVMYAGQIVETCKAAELGKAKHPYTRGLIAAMPRLTKPLEILPTLNRQESWRTEPGVDGRI
ncbi:Dipeptide transport ATP-binding protein DppD [Nitratireductor aquibiodomus RA22]|uniref:Peptide/nickel transport system ATP-binding protein n=2 Tax=Nitratireductor aquibiodomus TaxID=204799 RepID=A0A1H4JDR3_9HYPH|nr:ABC transporter ATP-binding protein [Nitratireductor aquibiodomus]EIM73232.1 Dipeptide transport ATP-binding protein DppD [Nitratireductor aquibiodomus RA22]SEB44126.1 peptide/nickel transport system ATP-binding protein [Nitratireductor aquibiodomus]